MNKGMLTVGIILMALIALLMVNIVSNYSTGGELDYYLLKETTSASMEDAIDWQFYRNHNLFRIDKEKFVESFLRRFADSVDRTRSYNVKIYDINELPPKVSVKIDSATVLSFEGDAAAISTQIDSILETNYIGDPKTESGLVDPDSDIGKDFGTKAAEGH